ncbi:MAG: NADP-dependent isocitrate dehydrogenase [Thermonemataceae bacterium]
MNHSTLEAEVKEQTAHSIPVTVAYGDGIGPEIMKAVLLILEKAGAAITPEVIEIGEKVYLSGNTAGIDKSAWESLRKTKVFLKAPITTPQGGGYKSLNVTTRKTLGLFANVRPCVAYAPFVTTNYPETDMVIIRENEEDLYAGIEHRQTQDVVQCLKLITRSGCEKVIRYAFEYASTRGRKKVTCLSKDNIMKLTDGLFHKVFDEVSQEYPELETEHLIIDIGAARLATRPEMFDVVVTSNLYGDIVSDIAAEVTGSVGMAGSANIGMDFAMFEAIHGSAPDIAGQDIANPSGLLMGAVKMLLHIGQAAIAENIHNAWLKTLEDGIHTADVYNEDISKEKVGTQAFAEAVISRLGQKPNTIKPVTYNKELKRIQVHLNTPVEAKKELLGVDIFIDWNKGTAEQLGKELSQSKTTNLQLQMMTNRGVKVYPDGLEETYCTDHWRCRFIHEAKTPVTYKEVIELLNTVTEAGFEVIKTENLYSFDGKIGFSLGQGQ